MCTRVVQILKGYYLMGIHCSRAIFANMGGLIQNIDKLCIRGMILVNVSFQCAVGLCKPEEAGKG